jgi:hypothetical protein
MGAPPLVSVAMPALLFDDLTPVAGAFFHGSLASGFPTRWRTSETV